MNFHSSVLTIGAVLHLSLAGFAAAQTIGAPATSSDGPWGPGDSFSFGESITAPVGSDQLQSFTFTGLTASGGGDFDYKTYVYAFNTSTQQVTGSALYTGGVQTLTGTTVADVITPNLTVTAGNVYLVYVSSTGLTTNPGGLGYMETDPTHSYTGGEFYQVRFLNPSSTWSGIPFNAAFSAVFGFVTLNSSFSLITGLDANERGIASNIDTASIGSSNAISNIVSTLSSLPVTSVAGALDQLSPAKVAEFYSGTAINNASIDVQAMDSYFAGQRVGPNGTFAGGNGQLDSSGFVVNDPNVDPGLQMIHSRMLAWNDLPSTISDVPGAVLGGIDMKEIKQKGCAACAENDKPWNFFLRGSVILGQGFSQQDIPHYDDSTASVLLGADYRITPHVLVGVTAGYAHTDATLDPANSSATVDSYSPGIYASYADNGWYANFLGRYSYNSYTSQRVIAFLGQSANGATDGHEGTASLDGGYNFHTGALSYGPIAGLQYTHLTVNSYSESGSDANLAVAQDETDSLRSRLGGTVRFDWQHGGMTFSPHLEATWQHEFIAQDRGLTSQFTAFNGGSFTVRTNSSSRDSALVDAGLDAQIDNTFTVFADYLVEAGQSDYFGQSVQAGVRINF